MEHEKNEKNEKTGLPKISEEHKDKSEKALIWFGVIDLLVLSAIGIGIAFGIHKWGDTE